MRTITVIDTTEIKSGTSAAGKPWTLWEVTAVSEDGAPIEEKLKTFDELKPGPVQVEVDRQDDEKYGTSFMLKLPRGSEGASPPPAGARLGPKVDELRTRVEALEARVEQVVDVVSKLAGRSPLDAPPAADHRTTPLPDRGAMF